MPALLDVAVPASELSRGGNLARGDIERLIGHDPLEPAVLILERPHFRDIADLQAAELRLPRVEDRATDAVLAAEIGGLYAGLMSLEHGDGLSFAEPRFLHGASPGEAGASEIRTHRWDTFTYTRHRQLSDFVLQSSPVRDRVHPAGVTETCLELPGSRDQVIATHRSKDVRRR